MITLLYFAMLFIYPRTTAAAYAYAWPNGRVKHFCLVGSMIILADRAVPASSSMGPQHSSHSQSLTHYKLVYTAPSIRPPWSSFGTAMMHVDLTNFRPKGKVIAVSGFTSTSNLV
jgi:hypothetical protein